MVQLNTRLVLGDPAYVERMDAKNTQKNCKNSKIQVQKPIFKHQNIRAHITDNLLILDMKLSNWTRTCLCASFEACVLDTTDRLSLYWRVRKKKVKITAEFSVIFSGFQNQQFPVKKCGHSQGIVTEVVRVQSVAKKTHTRTHAINESTACRACRACCECLRR